MSENRCVCCGAVIPEGGQVCKKCETMAEHKTADEMFRELGYERAEDTPMYVTYEYEDGDSVIRYNKVVNIFACIMGDKRYGFTPEEMVACVQLAKEMGCIDE